MGKRSGIMLAYSFDEGRLARWGFPAKPVIVQPKLDGERCRALAQASGPVMLSSECNSIDTLPAIKESITTILTEDPKLHLDGELYCQGMDKDDIRSVISTKKTAHPDRDKMEYHVFDLVNYTRDQYVRLTHLTFVSVTIAKHNITNIKVVESYTVHTMEELMQTCDAFIQRGYEGMIVRNMRGMYVDRRSTDMMKWKPSKTAEYEILGWKCEFSQDKNVKYDRIGALSCANEEGETFKVSCSKFTHEERAKLWRLRYELRGKIVTVEYQNLTKRGVPRFGRAKSIALINFGD